MKAIEDAVGYCKYNNFTVLTSLGMNTWELTLTRAVCHGANNILIIPDEGRDHDEVIKDTTARFRLEEEKTGFVFLDSDEKGRRKKNWPQRDCKIIQLADFILPVSIRPDGTLEKKLNQYPGKLRDEFRVAYCKITHRRPSYENRKCHPDLPQNRFIVHFTRSSAAPWPDETAFNYYCKIVDSAAEYCHCAREALLNILKTKTIYASGKNMRDGQKVVGFTALESDALPRLFRYRSRLVNPYFEPFGIGITYTAATEAGIRPVRYGSPDIYPTLDSDEKPYFQNEGGDGGRWRSENEWRFRGDFHFSDIPRSETCLLVPDESHVERISGGTDLRVIPVLEL